jgi:hypothetical protein
VIFLDLGMAYFKATMIHVPNFMTIGSGIQATLRSLPELYEKLKSRYYLWDLFMTYAVDTDSVGGIYIWRLMTSGLGIQYWWKVFIKYAF